MLKTGDCVVKHPGIYAIGIGMVVNIFFVLRIFSVRHINVTVAILA